MATILITGGSGYLGFHIALELFQKGFKVILFDLKKTVDVLRKSLIKKYSLDENSLKKNINFVQGNICDFSSLRDVVISNDVEAIIHCASFGMSGNDNLPANNDTIEKVNLGGTRNVLKAASKSKVKAIVYTSTVNVVFNGQVIINGNEANTSYLGLTEHADHYSLTKQVAEELILTASGKAQPNGVMRTCSLRLNGIYGAYEQQHLPRSIAIMRQGLFKVGYCLDTKQDLVHIDNAVQGHVKAVMAMLDPKQAEKMDGEAYFITDGHPVNNLKFFGENLLPAILGQDAKMPEFEVPFLVVLGISWVFFFLSKALGKNFLLPVPAITTAEVYKTGVTHFFNVEKANSHFGYKPEVKWDQKSWDEILESQKLARPILKPIKCSRQTNPKTERFEPSTSI
eukprot:TCALIF_12892-PA protein Name:"Similar to SDR42E1 Short-chain dehydrogenase/reductase family 42E member 1 (Macaca fascicularis)" AED:0.06 eAED:0.07 QI:74/1/0.8/1/0.5/0.6/5/126/397